MRDNSQTEAFLSEEGDAYYERNGKHEAYRKAWESILADVWERLPMRPSNMLEVGAGKGGSLAFLSKRYGVDAYGIEPSAKAVAAGSAQFPKLKLQVGAASALPYDAERFDCVFFGFCLYLCDRTDLFTIAREADRVLRPGGVMLILDFSPPVPYRNTYHHRPGIYSYKMRYRDMFLWNPSYSEAEMRCLSHAGAVFHPDPNERIELSVLYKAHPEACWLTDPFEKSAGAQEFL